MKKQQGTSLPKPRDDVLISVVVPSFNSRRTIGETLTALLSQKTRHRFEIIVVDSSTDGTGNLIAQEFPAVRLFRLERQTYPGSGRNLGVMHALGEYIAFTDSDCAPDPDWLERIVADFQTRETDAVGGCVINGHPESLTAWVNHLMEFNEWTECMPEGFVKNIPTCDIAYRRHIFFDRALSFTDIFPSEDTIFNWTLTNKSGRIYFDPRIRVSHRNRISFKELLRHQFILGQASAEARRTTTLPGHIFVRFPVLSLLLPFVRWSRTFWRLLEHDRAKCFIFVALTPLYLPAVSAWSLGFMSKRAFKPTAITITADQKPAR
jgi:glycosyltransferase involved in cell wall biosynthesis